MTHPASGNAVWQDYPSTATLVNATRLNNIENALDTPFACLRRYRSGSQTGVADAVTDIQLNATDTSVSRGSGLAASGNGISVTSAGLYLVTFEVLFSGGTSGNRALQIKVNGTIVRDGPDVQGATTRLSSATALNVAASAVITLSYYVFPVTAPTIGGAASADTGLTVLRLTT